MTIVNSQIIEDHAQHDGRRSIRERHVDHLGVAHDYDYMCPAAFDANAAMTNRVVVLLDRLAVIELEENELRALSGDFVAPTLQHITAGQYRSMLRELFKQSKGFGTCRLAWYVQQIGLTDNQLKSMFGVNDAQLVTLKAKLVNLETKYNDAQSQQGE